MPAAIFNNATRGLVTIRNLLKTGFSPFVGVTDDGVAFNAAQVTLNPTGGATSNLIKAATITNVSDTSYDATISINGTTEFTNKVINATGALTTATPTDAQSRTVRPSGFGFGVIAGDNLTVGLRVSVADNS